MKRSVFPGLAALVVALMVGILCSQSGCERSTSAPKAELGDAPPDVDFDFTRMNQTMRMTYVYRLAANPQEFEGKKLRFAGTFLTRVDEADGKRYFGCLMGESGGCSCCSPGGVMEFEPKETYKWPEGFPPEESRIVVCGTLKIVEIAEKSETYMIPRLAEADIQVRVGGALKEM